MVLKAQKRLLEDDGWSYICKICQDFGELLCCERCGHGFHLSCLNLDKMPMEESWLCCDCKDNKVLCFECKNMGDGEFMLKCLHKNCKKFYHQNCTASWPNVPKFATKRKCPHHMCNACGSRKNSGPVKLFRCLECPAAYHERCCPDGSRLCEDIPGYMICSKHDSSRRHTQDADKPHEPAHSLQSLPVPYQFCEFEVPRAIHEFVKKLKNRPQPYVHIRRNIYLVKKPKKRAENEFMQCACARAGKSRESCDRDCICSMLQYSCSEGCGCGPSCTNLPFQKRVGRKLDLVKTDKCGWGLRAGEKIKAGDFLTEYVGEVIDDKTCEERLWGMKDRGESNFYMCEINREMVIDASFKGNLSRFINHSCCPNTQLQKWQIDEEMRIGVFAISDIAEGESISYDYQFIPFGQEQTCYCGASACRGKLGRKPSKQKISASVALQIVRREIFGSRPIKKARLCGFHMDNGYKSIDQIFRQRKLKFGTSTHYGAIVCLPQQRSPTTTCLGLRVRVWWPLDQKFYTGRIIGFDELEGTHKIEYDDGDCEVLHMNKEMWELENSVLPLLRKRRSEVSTDAYTSEESFSPASSGDFTSQQQFMKTGVQLQVIEETMAIS